MLHSFLDWRCALFLSQDKVGIAEVERGSDFHSDNQKRYKFPAGKEGRDLAKTFLYRMIFKGPAYAYANDPRFMGVSGSEKFWQNIIDTTYDKYHELADWHTRIIQQVNATGRLSIPTGRVYEFRKTAKGEYSERDITCYPVQGLEAELMAIARVTAYRRYQKFHLKDKFLFVNTVHDSIVEDADVREGSEELMELCEWNEDIFNDIPRNFEKLYGLRINIPIEGECKYGMNWNEMTKFKRSN